MSPLLSLVSPNESTCSGTGNSVTGIKKKKTNIFHVVLFFLTIFKECKTYFLDLPKKKKKKRLAKKYAK